MSSEAHVYAKDPPSSASRTSDDDIEAQRLPFPALQHTSDENLKTHRVTISDSAKPPHETNGDHTPTSVKAKRTGTGFSGRSSLDGLKRRPKRSSTAHTYQPAHRGSGWEPGQEPGVDTSDPAPPYAGGGDLPDGPTHFQADCEITVIDWSQDNMQLYRLDNDNLAEFLDQPKPEWVMCRWINVNGLSWDVIRLLGNHKGLHRLAIEDLMNTRNRTKADWFNDHTFMVLALQKLVNLQAPEDCDSEDSESDDKKVGWKTKKHFDEKNKHKGAVQTLLKEWFGPKRKAHLPSPARINSANGFAHSSSVTSPWSPHPVRTLQRFHSGPNEDRTEFMERHAALAAKGFGVAMEQVSIFLNSDNTVTSFFESSAEDVEIPIIKRLQTPETILRQSCDASMLIQAIIDAIVDLAIPVTAAYQDAIGDLELQVLTDPSIQQSSSLYILTSEITVLRNAIAPISAIINALKDHKNDSVPTRPATPNATSNDNADGRPHVRHTATTKSLPLTSPAVTISPLTHTYLGDIEDHILLITQSYDSIRKSADNLIDLIFNTISAYQNESMKQLTVVTCMFLPLSFLTGYFGMNFHHFAGIQGSDAFFWKIAVPFVFATMMFLMRDAIGRAFVKSAQKQLIKRGRARRDGEKKRQGGTKRSNGQGMG